VRRKVHHRVDARQHRPQPRLVGNVALHQFKTLRQAAESGGEIIVEHNLIAGPPQRSRRMTANVPRTARYQDCQGFLACFYDYRSC